MIEENHILAPHSSPSVIQVSRSSELPNWFEKTPCYAISLAAKLKQVPDTSVVPDEFCDAVLLWSSPNVL